MQSQLGVPGPRPSETDAPSAVLKVDSDAERTPTAGLVVFDVAATLAPGGTAILRVFGPGAAAPALERTLELRPEPTSSWVAVHGHLLPNGPAAFRFELSDVDGRSLAQAGLEVQVHNAGALADATRDSLHRSGAPLVVDVCDSGDYDYADQRLTAWFDREPDAVEAHLAALAEAGAATPAEIAALRHFAEEGYLVLPDLIDAAQLERLNAAVDDAVARGLEGYVWGQSQRIHALHTLYPAIHDLWTHSGVLRMLGLVFDAPATPYQSLTFVFGSEQGRHQDTVALTPFPAGRMCGVWTALEDVQPDSGELVIFPKSHRLPRIYMKDAGVKKVTDGDYAAFGQGVAAIWRDLLGDEFEREFYRPKAGTVLIWHENLMHGGKVRADRAKSRRSVVCHYFADGCVAYHDASGMPGVFGAGRPAADPD